MILPQYNERVEPNTQAAPNFQTGSPVAQAGEELGRTIEGVGGQFQEFAHQEKVKADQTVTRDSYVNFSKEIIDLESDGLRKKGKDAFDVNTYGQKFSEIKDKYRSQLKNRDQVFMFDNQTKMEELRFTTSLHRHAAIEADELNKGNAKAQTEMDEQKLSLGYQDPANYDEKNPLSPISKFLVSVDEQAKINGLSEKDPEYKELMASAKSKAYVDRIKLLMTDRPSEALKFYKEHEADINVEQRETLGKTLEHLSDEQQGMNAAFSYLNDITNGKKTETEITKELHDKFADNPGSFKVAQAELNHLFAQNHADQVNTTAGVGTKIEAAVDKAVGQGQVVSLKLLKSIPEYNDLEKLAASGNKPAEVELNRLKSYTSKTEAGQKREAKQISIENRKVALEEKRQKKEDAKQFMLDTGDPNTLRTMNKTDLYERGRKAGLSYAQLKTMEASREKAIKDSNSPKEMHNHHIQTTLLPAILEKAQIPENEQEDFGKAWAGAVKAKEDELQRPLTDEEIQQAGLMGIQSHATNSWNPFKAKNTWTDESKAPSDKSNRDLRADGSKKGTGYLGVLPIKGPNGENNVATEYSVGVKINGKQTDIPSLVPTLTKDEQNTMVNDVIPNHKSIPPAILKKAISHAEKRIKEGKSPFAADSESPKPKTVKLPDGKDYKDGDIYTDPKTGKKSRVKVNG